MLSISALPSLVPNQLRGLLFDLDDTFLDHSRLSEAAYSSLFRLREAGFECYAVTGRPAGWAAVIVNLTFLHSLFGRDGRSPALVATQVDDGQGLRTSDDLGTRHPASRADNS